MMKHIANLKIIGRIVLAFLVYLLVLMTLVDAYHKTNISYYIVGTETLCKYVWWFNFSCLGLTIYYAARTIQKEMYIFKKLNQKKSPITNTGANNANPT